MEDTLRIIVATDNHLGYCERDAIRKHDSFDTFEEILRIAHEQNADCILLGGDLFHDNRPSRFCTHRTMELLRHYCMGSRPCAMQLLSDPSINFDTPFGTVNYEDPNYNVSMPVFCIHGNHDDPTGDPSLSPIDLLATAGLLNYFGKTPSVDDIQISPILLRKGSTHLALYGLGAIRDERLHRAFLRKKVRFLRAPQHQQYTNLMVLHQNRIAHTPTSYIPDHFLDDHLDCVIWGHEHECQVCAESSIYYNQQITGSNSYATQIATSSSSKLRVIQPGSSVATSLSQAEVRAKHIVMLSITGKNIVETAIPLRTVRPFIMKDICLSEAVSWSPHDLVKTTEFLKYQVNHMLQTVQSLAPNDKLPLVRLRVDYSSPTDTNRQDFAAPHPFRFAQLFLNRVANPRDLISLLRRRSIRNTPTPSTLSAAIAPAEESVKVTDMAQHLLSQNHCKLGLLPQNELSDVVQSSIEKDDKEAIARFIEKSMDQTVRVVAERLKHTSLLAVDRQTLMQEFATLKSRREADWSTLHSSIAPPCATTTSTSNNNKRNRKQT